MGLPPGATLVSGSIPDVSQLPPGATLVSGSLPASSSDASTEGTGFWAHVGKSLRSMAPEDVPSFTDTLKQAGISSLGPGYNAIQALHNAATEYAAARSRGHGVPYSAAAGASSTVGVSPERMEQAAAQGDTAGVLGETAVPTAMAVAPLGAEGVAKSGLPSAFKSVVADMKPDLVSHLEKTHSLTGQAAAYLAEKILPDSPEALAQAQRLVEEGKAKDINDAITIQDTYNRRIAREKAAQDRVTARQQATAAKEAAKPAAPFPPVLGPDTPTPKQMAASQAYQPPVPVYPGASEPSAEDFYANRGEEIARAMKQQPEAFAPSPAPTFPGASLPSAEDFYSNRGEELNDIRKMQDLENRRQAAKVKSAQDTGLQIPSASSTPKSASEGRPATWTNDTVRQLAAWGDSDAITQARLRGFGTIPRAYSIADITPKSTTSFDASGNPIPAEGNFGYRVRDVGEKGVPISGNSRAHATTTLEDAQRIAPGREDVQGKPQEIVKYDLSKMKEGKDYVRVPREGQPDWIRMLRPLHETEVQPVEPQ